MPNTSTRMKIRTPLATEANNPPAYTKQIADDVEAAAGGAPKLVSGATARNALADNWNGRAARQEDDLSDYVHNGTKWLARKLGGTVATPSLAANTTESSGTQITFASEFPSPPVVAVETPISPRVSAQIYNVTTTSFMVRFSNWTSVAVAASTATWRAIA